MSKEEEIIEYEDLETETYSSSSVSSESKSDSSLKASHVGIHSTSFRDFNLKAELLKAIADNRFEHPSQGTDPRLCSDICYCTSSRLNLMWLLRGGLLLGLSHKF